MVKVGLAYMYSRVTPGERATFKTPPAKNNKRGCYDIYIYRGQTPTSVRPSTLVRTLTAVRPLTVVQNMRVGLVYL
jgi:hypothetical protein